MVSGKAALPTVALPLTSSSSASADRRPDTRWSWQWWLAAAPSDTNPATGGPAASARTNAPCPRPTVYVSTSSPWPACCIHPPSTSAHDAATLPGLRRAERGRPLRRTPPDRHGRTRSDTDGARLRRRVESAQRPSARAAAVVSGLRRIRAPHRRPPALGVGQEGRRAGPAALRRRGRLSALQRRPRIVAARLSAC